MDNLQSGDYEKAMMDEVTKGVEELAVVNQKILADGESLPSVKLKDGTKVQTGTVATMLHNVNLYNAGERGQVEEEIKLCLPTLFKVGLFDLFTPEEWVNGNNPGRTFIGEQALHYLKTEQKMTDAGLL